MARKNFIGYIFFAVAFILIIKFQNKKNNAIYCSEGILGTIEVLEKDSTKYLFVNQVLQGYESSKKKKEKWEEIEQYKELSLSSNASENLLIGLGCGMILKAINSNLVDVVEFDNRIKDVAITYFDVPENTNIYIDDARHYLNTCKKKYNTIILDVFHGETPPSHVLTKETFEKMKINLKPGGLILMNYYGQITENKGNAAKSILKTLDFCNFETIVLSDNSTENNSLLIIAKNGVFKNEFIEKYNSRTTLINPTLLQDVPILTDDLPVLEKLNAKDAIKWKNMNNAFYYQLVH